MQNDLEILLTWTCVAPAEESDLIFSTLPNHEQEKFRTFLNQNQTDKPNAAVNDKKSRFKRRGKKVRAHSM